MRKHFRAVYILLFSANFLYAQLVTDTKGLKLGDKIPDSIFENVLNSNKAIKISDYMGEYVLLDFWRTDCMPCVRSFPKIQKLQEEFDNKIKFILVTDQRSSEIQDFLMKRKDLGFLEGFPIITGDSILS